MDGLDLSLGTGIASLLQRRPDGTEPPRRRRPKLLSPFMLVVVLPTLLSAIYFLFLASPQYVSEAQFVVRGQGTSSPGMLSSLLQTAGGSTASEDTYAVQDYMMSRDATVRLVQTVNLKTMFARRDADPIARFPNSFTGHSFEHFYRYYRRHVMADLDTTTGISTLTVRTFRPADSRLVAIDLMVAGEQLINRMNERQRQNTISSSAREVADAEAQLRQIGDRIASYRNRQALLDPMKQSVPMLKDINDLQTVLTTTRVQIAQLTASAPDSPLLPVYERRVAALEAQIARSSTGVTGSDTSLVPKITAYDELTIQQELDEKQLAGATTALEAAKTQADRQLLYLDEIVQPDLPDYADYPKGVASTLVIFASLAGLYLMARLLISGAREHQLV